MAVLTAALAALLLGTPSAAPAGDLSSQQLAAETPGQQRPGGMPKGSYQQSCQCQLSGGMTLLCMCANINARYFQTTLDVRSCQPPKDIKNCDGRLKCVDGPAAEC